MASVQRRFWNLVGRSWMLVLTAIAGGVAGLAYASLKAPDYTANAFVITTAGSGGESSTALNFAQAYGRVAARQETLVWAQPPLSGLATAHLLRHLRASTSPDAPLIELIGTGSTAQAAADYANAGANALVRYGNAHKKETGVRLVLLSGALPPSEPTSPNPPLDIAIGTATGVLLGGLLWAAAAERRAGGRRRMKEGGRRAELPGRYPDPYPSSLSSPPSSSLSFPSLPPPSSSVEAYGDSARETRP